jgi:diguanylate cyclase (GGDEF)-like protein
LARGSTLRMMTLGVIRVAIVEPDSAHPGRVLAEGSGMSERPPRILVVDDDDDVRAFATTELEATGFLVDTARDGAEALLAIDDAPPDLVIADLEMPRIDGRELLAALRRRYETSTLPFIVLSGAADTGARVACLDAGASDVVCKPVDGVELAARARLQLRTARTMRRLRTASEVDELTELLNRRGLMRALDRELAHSRREREPLALLLVDVDRFKRINDCHGHLVGDRALQAIADNLSLAVRAGDTVGRLAGDEFVIILPNTGPAVAGDIADRIRRSAADDLRVPGTDEPIGLSIGVVAEPPSRRGAAQLLDAADRAMYLDKAGSLHGA